MGLTYPFEFRLFRTILDNDIAVHGGLEGATIEELIPATSPSETELQVEETIDGANDAGVQNSIVPDAQSTTIGTAVGSSPSVGGGSVDEGIEGGAEGGSVES